MTEHQTVEYKQVWRDEYLKWICGFANAQGGELVIGKDDQGQVAGVHNARKLLEKIPNQVRDLMGLMVDVDLHQEGDLNYLVIKIEPYPYPISLRGAYHYRSGSTKQELKGAALDRFLLRKQGKHWDAVPVPHVAVDDLSENALKQFRTLALNSKRLTRTILDEENPALIEKLHLIDGAYLKRAAILLFHPDPEKYVTGAFVKIGFFRTNADLLYHDEVHGDRLMIWNSGQLPENWSVENLMQKHSSEPYNPDIANTFFRAGSVEIWGRGIERITDACHLAGLPAPAFEYVHTGLWTVFSFTIPDSVKKETQVEARVEARVKTPEKIIDVLRENPGFSLAEVASHIGKSLSAVERATAKMVREGRLQFVGPKKGGHWQVLR